jgi:hypothetical protein
MADVVHKEKIGQVGSVLLTHERLQEARRRNAGSSLQGRIHCFLLLVGLLFCGVLQAQTRTVHIRFAPTYAGVPLELGAHYSLSSQDSVVFETLRFYVSELRLLQDDEAVAAMAPHHRLLDTEDDATLTFAVAVDPKTPFNKIAFQLGIDSATNSAGALAGDLDPIHGMYWAWQSGYINWKLEGRTPICPARNHVFQFHIGGYKAPYNSLQQVELAITASDEIVIQVAIDRLVMQLDLKATYEIMRPCEKAIELAGLIQGIFTVVP